MLQKYMDKFIEVATSGTFIDEITKAKKEYFSFVGEIFDDDKSFESKMSSFVEWYCFDRVMEGFDKTPIDHFNETNILPLNDDEKNIYKGFSKSIHSIFYIKNIQKGEIVIVDVSDSKKISVKVDGSNSFFHKNDLFEARIIPVKGEYHFTGSFCFHPMNLYKKIRKELKRKAGNQKEKNEFIFLLSSMSLRLERSKQIDFLRIYNF